MSLAEPTLLTPASGCRVVQDDCQKILFGQPPEVLKGLLINNIDQFDTLVLTDIKEKDGSLLNNLEFPFYFFLFVAKGLADGRRLRLVGDEVDISQALRLLRFTLLGPTESELVNWGTEPETRREWLEVSKALALSDENGVPIAISDFFELIPFRENVAQAGDFRIEHQGLDIYQVHNESGSVLVDLNEDQKVDPTYQIQSDYVPGGLVRLGMEVLGGASGFTLDEPCTGLALCYNGDYLLIDSTPFLDQNLFARGIAKNQISAVFLTHLHDDHCSMFPLMKMPHRVDVITTVEIFNMAMEKLACGLGWRPEVVAEHFNLVAVKPGVKTNYYGMEIESHVTVHSIPTVGAVFTTHMQGRSRRLCVVGDNHSMTTIRELNHLGVVRDSTLDNLEHLYRENWNLLVADGGAGAIHGNPADAIKSEADRVVFVHVDELPTEFNTTFSLASSGKRYTVLDGDRSIYTSQMIYYLTAWLGRPVSSRWMRSLLADEEIRRYNQGDVIIVQGAETKGLVYLILTGYCEVVRHDGKKTNLVARLLAGDVIGEMAVVTGIGTRNASVVASSPATVCVFAEDTFRTFVEHEGFADELMVRWELRPVLEALPQFETLSSMSIEKLSALGASQMIQAGQIWQPEEDHWYILSSGDLRNGDCSFPVGAEFGWQPFSKLDSISASQIDQYKCESSCNFVRFSRDGFEALRLELPELNYMIRKWRVLNSDPGVDWKLGPVPILDS